jgi:hypothetical protein
MWEAPHYLSEPSSRSALTLLGDLEVAPRSYYLIW